MTADEQNSARSNYISQAMSLYLKRLSDREKIYNEHVTEYELGKRHLARIMGFHDSDLIDDYHIEKYVRYLFPSGVFEKLARPIMKHPSEIFYSTKEAQFGYDGRPFNYLFFTLRPNFYTIMHDLGVIFESLKYNDASENPNNVEKISATEWISIESLKERCLESITENEYKRFVALLNRIIENRVQTLPEDVLEVIMNYRTQKMAISCIHEIKEPLVDENGDLYQVATATKKRCKVNVHLTRGNGEITIKSPHFHTTDILYFVRMIHREYLMMPFVVTDTLGQFNATIILEGQYRPTCEAVAARQAIAVSLTSFMDAERVEKLRLCGLLTDDIRLKERKMYGRRGARKRHKT
ncbi:hypothetical protein ACOME3_001050 [Neoechinorhynchus agilis]